MLLAGKKIVVVGGSSGIGLATAELAKREGADVTIASRNAERLKAAAEKIGVIAIPADVTAMTASPIFSANAGRWIMLL